MKKLPILVYNIWGDHAFFYDTPDAKKGAGMLTKRASLLMQKQQQSMVLKVDEKLLGDSELFSDMEYYYDAPLQQCPQQMDFADE